MDPKYQSNEMLLREAFKDDIALMARHHRKMFEEIWERKGEHLDASTAADIEHAYVKKLEEELECGTCRAWVIEDDERIIASGGITFVSVVPQPSDLSSRAACLHSMYTDFIPQRFKKIFQPV